MRSLLTTLVLASLIAGTSVSGVAQTEGSAGDLQTLLHASEVDDAAVGYAATRTEVYGAFR